jgi:hypothetical protein
MGKSKLALALGLLLCLNFLITSARPWDEDEDAFGDLFEDKSEEDSEEPEAPPVVAPRAMSSPKKEEPAKDDWMDSDEDDDANQDQQSGGHNHHQQHDGQIKFQVMNNPPGGAAPQAPEQPKMVPPQQPSGAVFGGNIAPYNESCAYMTCNGAANMECSAGKICTCIANYVYIRSQERCYPIAVGEMDCEFNDQCHAARWGKLSRCSRTEGKCECYDIETSGKREITNVKGVCMVKKNIEDICTESAECQATIKGEVTCDYPDSSVNPGREARICRCANNYIWNNLLDECVKIATDGLASTCKSDIQCQVGSLGDMSRCSADTKLCECHDPAKPGNQNVVFYKPRTKCFAKKDFNDTCREHDECKASISSQAECLVTQNEDGVKQETCQCPEGKTCPRDVDNPDSSFVVGGSGFFTVVAFAITLVYTRW